MRQSFGDLSLILPDPADWTLDAVISRRARTHGDKTFLREGTGRSTTFAAIDRDSLALAAGLAHAGFGPGDRIGLLGESTIDYVTTWFAASRLGAVTTPINTEYRGASLTESLNLLGCCALFVSDQSAGHLACIIEQVPCLKTVVTFPGSRGDASTMTMLRECCTVYESEGLTAGEGSRWSAAPARPDKANLILSTSGTTGRSKGVMLPDALMYIFAEEIRHGQQLTDADVYLLDKPMFGPVALLHTVYTSLLAGAEVAIYAGFSAGSWLQRLRESGVTAANAVSTMVRYIMAQEPTPEDARNALRTISLSPTPWDVIDGFTERFGVADVVETYGQTEISVVIMTPPGRDRPVDSCGLGLDQQFDLVICDPVTDQEVSPGDVGELQVRNRMPWLMHLGYCGMPDETVRAFRNLRFHTGDAFRQSEDGWFYFVDRLHDTIRRKGVSISPSAIENTLRLHPDIADSAVVGVGGDASEGAAEILACIVLEQGKAPDPHTLEAFACANLPAYSVPRYLKVVDELPKTPSGKVKKADLQALSDAPDVWDRLAP